MSSVRGGRGGANRGRGTSTTFTAPKAARPSFAPRAGRQSNQVRFNAQPRGGTSAQGERGGKATIVRGAHRGRGRSTTPVATSVTSQSQPQAQSRQSNGSSSLQDRFEALKRQRKQQRELAIRQGFLADPDKPRTLAEAITPVGTCPDMCSEFERVERQYQNDVWGPETDDNGNVVEDRMVKKFRRAAAGLDEQLPSDLRPPSALSKTVDYLFNNIVANASSLGSVHHFVWDRTRAIRNDFSIQQITKPSDVEIAIDCYERIARFHILSLHQLAIPDKPYDKYDWYQEREQLDRTLLSLMQYYDDSRGRLQCRNEAEFRAYLIIFQAQDPTPDLDERVNTWPLSVKSDKRVRIALDLNSAASNVVDPQGPLKPRALYPVAREDWCHFFDLVRSTKVSYLMACVSEIYFKLVRRTALNAIWRGFNNKVHDFTLPLMTDLLAFDDEEQTETFCQHFGFVFKESDAEGEVYLDLNSVQGKTIPPEAAGLDHQTFSEGLVENKRMGRNFSAVIGGYTVADAQNLGLIDESYDSQMDDSRAEEDADSLFVPEDPPKSVFGSAEASSSPFAGVFGSTKPVADAQPSLFTQSKPAVSGFGQPSTSSPFSFGKPSADTAPSETSTDSVTLSKTSPFAKPPSAAGFSPFASPFQPTALTNTIDKKVDEKPTEPTASPFTLNKPPAVEGKSASQSQFPSPSGLGSSSLTTSPSLWNSATSSTAPKAPTSETTSIFKPVTQNAPTQPSFSFTPIPEATPQPSVTSSSPSSTPFKFTSVAANIDPAPTTESTHPPFSAATSSLFSPPTQSSTEAPAIPPFTSTPPLENDAPDKTTISSLFPGPKPQFNLIQPNQPKKPSPLSQSFSLAEKNDATSSSPSTSESSQFSPTAPLPKPSPPAAGQITSAPPPKPAKTKDEILEELARQVVLDADRGLIRQFVEYHARQTVMGVYDELYMESTRELADTFRKETLAYRYGKRWREICWRRRLARQGRERRKRAKKDQSARELKRKLAAERDAVDDFLKSTSQAKHAASSVNGVRVGKRDYPGVTDHNEPQTNPVPTNHQHNHKRLKSDDETNLKTPARKQPAATPRSNFLGFSMLGSQNRAVISSTPSRSNYFRLKALGINPANDITTVSQSGKKRAREDSEEASTGASPPRKRSQTPPAIAEVSTITRSQGLISGPDTGNRPSPSLRNSSDRSKPTPKVYQEDEELFARARAARKAMAESGAWYRSEIEKDEIRRSEEMTRSLTSPSMERARQAARLRSTFNASTADSKTPDVPAYRLRESRFVPREHYNLAIEKAKQKIESRSRSPSHASSPVLARSPLDTGAKRNMAQSASDTQRSRIFASSTGLESQAIDSMAQLAALHKVPENPAWQYEPSFFAGSIDPSLSVNGFAEQTPSKSASERSPTSEEQGITEFVDLGSESESEVVQQDESSEEVDDDESQLDDESQGDDESDGLVGGYAQDPDDLGDEEEYDEEEVDEIEEEEYDDIEDEDEGSFEDSSDDEMTHQVLPSDSGIKAGTGTAEDAFELSD